MKRSRYLFLGLLLYLLVLGLLFRFDLLRILQPVPMLSVVLGMVILTLFQYAKGMTKEDILSMAQWNAFFAGLLSSLLSLLTLFPLDESKGSAIEQVADKLVPLIYGSILYLILDLFLNHDKKSRQANPTVPSAQAEDIFSPAAANPILAAKGLSPRECHVALKMMEGISNKEIAQLLYISESTVKKHIQNIFKKCGATDRHQFLALYTQWVSEDSQ